MPPVYLFAVRSTAAAGFGPSGGWVGVQFETPAAGKRRRSGDGTPELPNQDDEPLVRGLQWAIRMAVRALAVLMTGVIVFGVADVVYVLYKRLMAEPRGLLQISDILATFGAFMAVLIAIEIFVNIISYLREDVIHVRIVLATAMMAIARKVIILDYNTTSPQYIYATAAVVAAMALAYWLVVRERLTKADEE